MIVHSNRHCKQRFFINIDIDDIDDVDYRY